MGSWEEDRNPDRGVKQDAFVVAENSPRTPGVPWSYDNFQFSRALEAIWTLISAVDAYITTKQPWALAEDEKERGHLARILYIAAEALRFVAVLAYPVLPDSTRKIWKQLGQGGSLEEQRIDALQWGQLKPGTKIARAEALFPRIDRAEAIERMEAMENEAQKQPSPVTAPVTPSAPAAGGTAAAPATQTAPEKTAIEDFAK